MIQSVILGGEGWTRVEMPTQEEWEAGFQGDFENRVKDLESRSIDPNACEVKRVELRIEESHLRDSTYFSTNGKFSGLTTRLNGQIDFVGTLPNLLGEDVIAYIPLCTPKEVRCDVYSRFRSEFAPRTFYVSNLNSNRAAKIEVPSTNEVYHSRDFETYENNPNL